MTLFSERQKCLTTSPHREMYKIFKSIDMKPQPKFRDSIPQIKPFLFVRFIGERIFLLVRLCNVTS